MSSSTFKIYNASAGSGKTFALVKGYLALLLSSKSVEAYKHMLAITFTNKAVGEMKSRIIQHLKEFSSDAILTSSNAMFSLLCEELNTDRAQLHEKAKQVLKSIVHNYAAFEISTIDRFTQKLIRAFAHDLGLSVNFNVELDVEEVFSEAIDNLIARAGDNKELTTILVEFALQKADDDRSYNIEIDFMPIAKMLSDENHVHRIKAISQKNLADFKELKSNLEKKIIENTAQITAIARTVLQLIDEAGLQYDDFNRGYLPKHFVALSKANFSIKFSNKWQAHIADEPLYPKRVPDSIRATIDELQSSFVDAFETSKALVLEVHMHQEALKNLVPLMVLNEIAKEVELIKSENNILLISEFNSIISEHIKKQPAPYIYERIGEKFKHFFIDEFQDTSVMQWENLLPLIDNALSGENASAALVGDAKQAIYRWRGGKAELFMNLFNQSQVPFPLRSEIISLNANYRSAASIVDFNNRFFKSLAHTIFSDKYYAELYETANQNTVKDSEGYLQLSFLQLDDADKDELYPKEVLNTIESCLSNGFRPKDICVLVRKKEQGVVITNYIVEQSDVDIMSSETLLLINSSKVVFILNVLSFLLNPENATVKIQMLDFITEIQNINEKHQFFASHIKLSQHELFEALKPYGIHFDPEKSVQFSIYELVETIINAFALGAQADAYIQGFLDTVLDYSLTHKTGLDGFLSYFDLKKEQLSLTTPSNQDAITVMTIHKAKGLEYPVVIFPYADVDIYYEKRHLVWFNVPSENYNGFDSLLLSYSNSLNEFGEQGQQLYQQHRSELELDNINLLYVALTRASEQLYIISNNRPQPSPASKSLYYSQLLQQFLREEGLWQDDKLSYSFGDQKSKVLVEPPLNRTSFNLESLSSSPLSKHHINFVAKSGLLWNTAQEAALEKGNLIHTIMAQIRTYHDVAFAFSEMKNSGVISSQHETLLKPLILQIIEHPQLEDYFTSNNTIYNEREILLKDGSILKPDRVVIKGSDVVLIDYKTGAFNTKHVDQINSYTNAIEAMNYSVKKRILVYINDGIEIKEL